MKTTVNQINSSIIAPSQSTHQANTEVAGQFQTGASPRAHIIDRRAARWARRSVR